MTPALPYYVAAHSVEACSCRHACNCQFAGFPTEGRCEFIIGYEVAEGHVGDVVLNGVRAVFVAKYPQAIHQGHGHATLFVDDRATAAQSDAFATILSGKLGGMPWEALAGTLDRVDGPIRRPVDISLAEERSHVRVPAAIELQLAPLTNPVTGVEKAVSIVYPKGGFFWNEGHIATTSVMSSVLDSLPFNWPGGYAAAAEVRWTNQK